MRQLDLVSLLLDAFGIFLDAIGSLPFGSVFLKVTLILGLATAACALLHRQSAAFRHRIWVLALGVTLALPLALLLPQFELRVLPGAVDSTRQGLTVAPEVAQAKVPIAPAEKTLPESKAEFSRQESALQVGMNTESTRAESATESRQDSIIEMSPARSTKSLGIGNLLVFTWLLGTTIASLLFVISLAIQTIQLSRLRRVNDDEWADSMNDAARRLGLQRPIITLESDQACVPAVVGILSPRLVVPHDWRTWSLAQRNCILLHELAHIKRFDVSTQFIGRLALLAYWFHPLVWFAVRQLRAERELASDDCVLLAGTAASDYAEELLRTLRRYRPVRPALGVAMAHSARLDQRVLAILDARRCRNPLGRTTAIVLLCLFGILGGVFTGVTLASRLVEETTNDRFQFHPEPVPATDLKTGVTAGKTVAVVEAPLPPLGDKGSRERKDDSTPKTREEVKVQGVWTLVRSESVIRTWPTDKPASSKEGNFKEATVVLVVTNELWIWKERGQDRVFAYKIDPKKNPKQIDLKLVSIKGEEEQTLRCIYEIDGDTLKVCESDEDRPREFKGGAENTLFVFKRSPDEKQPLTAKELTGKWFGEAENKNGIKKVAATLDFDIPLGGGQDVRWLLRYEFGGDAAAAFEFGGAAEIGFQGKKIEDDATGRVNLRFESGMVVLGHLARGENGTIVLTMLPEVEKRNMKDELIYRRFEGLVLRREEEPKGRANPSDRPGDSAPQ